MRPHIFLIFIILLHGCIEKPALEIALSFDYEGCSDEEIAAVFELIEKHNATATFFIMGKTAETNPRGVRMIHERNYSLGLHTYYHNFPIFEEEDVPMIADAYGESQERIWDRSFKTKDAFLADIILNQRAVMEAAGNATTPKMFRAPSLVVNWTRDPVYFETLRMAGIEIDSSIYQDPSNPRASYEIGGIREIPVTASDFDYQREETLNKMAADLSGEGVPMVFFFHPHNLKGEKLSALDDFLYGLESNYDATYIKIEEIGS